jgi:hypothetical protein
MGVLLGDRRASESNFGANPIRTVRSVVAAFRRSISSYRQFPDTPR